MPRLSDTMEEGILARWLKHPGEAVRRGDVIAEIETDKATMDLEAYEDGVLEALLVEEGATVSIGGPIAVIGTGDGKGRAPSPGVVTVEPSVTAPAPAPVPEPSGTASSGTARDRALGPVPRSSPLARRLAGRHGLDVADISGTGPGGRVVRADVEAAIARGGVGATPAVVGGRAPTGSPAAEAEEVPLTTVRRITAERLTENARAPHFYLTGVIDAAALVAFRSEIADAAEGTRITLTDVLVKACAKLLGRHPEVNSSWGEQAILRHRHINIGVAVAVPDGLVVPVVHDADRKSLPDIATEAHTLAERARAGRLSLDDIGGGTFTISNLGMYGVDHFTAVINPPQASILAVGAVQDEPVVRDGALAVGQTMKLTLSIDHRVLDGATAAKFLADLRQVLEHPLTILL